MIEKRLEGKDKAVMIVDVEGETSVIVMVRELMGIVTDLVLTMAGMKMFIVRMAMSCVDSVKANVQDGSASLIP